MLQSRILKGFKGSLGELVPHQGKVPGWNATATLGSVSLASY